MSPLSSINCKNEYLVLALREETAVQAVVGSIVWAFCRPNKPRNREMSARGYALHSVRPQLSIFPWTLEEIDQWISCMFRRVSLCHGYWLNKVAGSYWTDVWTKTTVWYPPYRVLVCCCVTDQQLHNSIGCMNIQHCKNSMNMILKKSWKILWLWFGTTYEKFYESHLK